MVLAFLSLAAIWLAYQLFVVGTLWKIVLFFAGGFGIWVALWTYFPASHMTVVIFDYPFSWAAVIATGICLMALLTTRTSD